RPYDSGLVRYYYPRDDIRHETIFSPFDEILYKRKQFQYEREFRMWRCDEETLQRLGDRQPEFDLSSLSRGMACSISDMPRLIRKAASFLRVVLVCERRAWALRLCVYSSSATAASRISRAAVRPSPHDRTSAAAAVRT